MKGKTEPWRFDDPLGSDGGDGGGEGTRVHGGFGETTEPNGNQEEHGVGGSTRNAIGGLGRPEKDGSGGMTIIEQQLR